MKPYDFKWTKFYESNSDFSYANIEIDLIENELIICSTIINDDNSSILTTRRLLTKQNGQLSSENIQGATDKLYGDFKGYENNLFTLGRLQLQNGNEFQYLIETGKASMVMVHAVRTFIRTKEMTNKQVDNVTRIWNRQNEK